RGLGLRARAEAQPARVLAAHAIVHGVASQEQVGRGAGAAQRVSEPDNRVVLLLQRGAVGGLDDRKNALGHGDLLRKARQRVGMTSVLREASLNLARSTGLPRRVP